MLTPVAIDARKAVLPIASLDESQVLEQTNPLLKATGDVVCLPLSLKGTPATQVFGDVELSRPFLMIGNS